LDYFSNEQYKEKLRRSNTNSGVHLLQMCIYSFECILETTPVNGIVKVFP